MLLKSVVEERGCSRSVSSANKKCFKVEEGSLMLARSLIMIKKSREPRMEPCGTPEVTGIGEERVESIRTH